MIEFNLPLEPTLSLLLGIGLPLLVGFVTTRVTTPGKRAVLLAIFSALAGLGAELLASVRADTVYDLGVGLLTALGTFLVAVGIHFGFWKPTGVADKAKNTGV